MAGRTGALGLLLTVLGASSAMAQQNVIADGGFEIPPIVNFAYNPGGSPWAFAGNSGIQTPPSGFSPTAAPEGVQTAFLQSATTTGTSSICQDVNGFLVGASYTISFQYAARAAMSGLCPSCSGGNPFEIRADGALVQTFPALTMTEVYTPGAAQFVAADSTLTICFVGLTVSPTGEDDRTTFIDAVRVNALVAGAPVLSQSMMMVAVGILLLLGWVKVRRAAL